MMIVVIIIIVRDFFPLKAKEVVLKAKKQDKLKKIKWKRIRKKKIQIYNKIKKISKIKTKQKKTKTTKIFYQRIKLYLMNNISVIVNF